MQAKDHLDKVLIAGDDEIRQLLPMRECIEVIDEMFKTLATGQVVLPLRTVISQPDGRGALALMPAYVGAPRKVLGAKVITVFPDNLDTPFESHQGCVLLFECVNGRLLSINDASTITAIRTAAASAVATKLLSRNDSKNLAILGSGVQASSHLSAMQHVRSIKSVKIWSRDKGHAEKFVEKHQAKESSIVIEQTDSVQDAVRDADIICTTTGSTTPILKGEFLRDGVHINAVGASRPQFRELDSDAVSRCHIYTDRIESLQMEAGDYLVPKNEGMIADERLMGEIGDLLIGKISGRKSSNEITLFKSLGIACEDLASASYVYERALEKNIGTWIKFGGSRKD